MDRKPTYEELEIKFKELQEQTYQYKRTEAVMEQAKSEWERTFNAVPNLIMILDNEYRIVRVNEAMADRLGVTVEEASGLLCYEHVHGLKAPPPFCPHSDLLADGQRRLMEVYEKRLGGHFLVSISPLHDSEGGLVGSVYVAHDITRQKGTEKALMESEERFRELAELLPQPVFELDPEGFLTYANHSGFEAFGYTQEELDQGVHALQLFHPEERQRVEQNIKKRLAGINFEDHEYIGLRKDGSTFPVLSYTSPIIRDGKTVGLRGIVLDITERKEAETALRESEEKYRSLVSLSPDPIVIVQDGLHQMVSSAFTELLGYTQQDVDNGLGVLEVIHPDYKETVRNRLTDRFSGKKSPRTLRVDMVAKDGRIVPCESSGVLIQYSGRPAILVIIRDITERKQIEERMIIFQKFAEASEQGLGMADLNGDITYTNPALCRQLGEKNPEDAIGKNVRIYYPDGQRQALENEILPAVIEKGHWTGELDLISIMGKVTHTIQSIFLIRDKAKKPFCVANVITDITEHKKLDKVLIHREKLKTLGAIAGEVAHEIRNPLTSLGGFAQRLKKKYPDSYECDIIINETQRLENILSRIRNYLEPVDIYPKECSINAIITSCVHLLSPETESREVKCVLDLDHELPIAYADPGILAQIIINLIRNATEAAEKGEILFIRSYKSGQDLYIEFKNRVLELKHEDPETLFMPFADGGKSVGLPLCYRLLKDMGGLLSFVRDEDFMVFTVSLPRTLQPVQKEDTPEIE